MLEYGSGRAVGTVGYRNSGISEYGSGRAVGIVGYMYLNSGLSR